MTEAFLHYVWQFQYFDKSDLITTSGEFVNVFHPGTRNTDSGPDFFNARIRIGAMEWIGNIEIHIDASSWLDHKHDIDPAYENVILHVVWNADQKIERKDGTELPTVELKNRITNALLLQYKKLINGAGKIPCASHFSKVTSLIKLSMLDRALMQRLEAKALQVNNVFESNNNDWDETAYQLLCRNFGFHINTEPFEQLSRSLPYKTILKHADKLIQVEALLFGQAGFLENKWNDEYFLLLRREYQLLSRKYNLEASRLNQAQWKFLRMRPANFPTLRIAQLASILSTEKNIFSRILEADTYNEMFRLLSVQQSGYWQQHYQFAKPLSKPVPALGRMSVDIVIINTVVPLLVAYGKARDEEHLVNRAADILQQMQAEENAVTRQWRDLDMNCTTAWDSQALLELYNNFCMRRKCLDCTIGFSILQPERA